jgi:hypothetical protein
MQNLPHGGHNLGGILFHVVASCAVQGNWAVCRSLDTAVFIKRQSTGRVRTLINHQC